MSHPVDGPLPGQPVQLRPPPAADDLATRIDRLTASFPMVPPQLRRMAAFVLASPVTSSDAALLFAEALIEGAKAHLNGTPRHDTIELAMHVAAHAPGFAGRRAV